MKTPQNSISLQLLHMKGILIDSTEFNTGLIKAIK